MVGDQDFDRVPRHLPPASSRSLVSATADAGAPTPTQAPDSSLEHADLHHINEELRAQSATADARYSLQAPSDREINPHSHRSTIGSIEEY
jgi:hypothetical protein